MILRKLKPPLLLAVVLGSLLIAGCSNYSSSRISGSGQSVTVATCAEVFDSALQRERTGDTAGAINSELDWLSGNCSAEYGVFVEYASAKASVQLPGGSSCDSVSQHISLEALALLTEAGVCPIAPPLQAESQPGGGIAWNDAVANAGTTQRVCGPLVGDGNPGDDVFLNLGLDYPDRGRFQIIIWDIGSIDPIPYGATLCTTGFISIYDGVAQIELEDPSQVQIYE